MSSLDNIGEKVVPSMESEALDQLHQAPPHPETEPQIGRDLAHELNNILTIIQGYAERIMVKHGDNPALRADALLISENARRAVAAIRKARPPRKPAATRPPV